MDTSSAESIRVFDVAEINKLPLPRNSVAVSILTPGATQDFEHVNFMHGSYGELPTDRNHQLKAWGSMS